VALATIFAAINRESAGVEDEWIGRSEGRTIDHKEVLRDVPLRSFKSLAFYADDFYSHSARRGYTIVKNISRNRRQPHHNRVTPRLCKNSLREITWKVCVYFQVTLKNSMGFCMRASGFRVFP
jgi:hypothetical protein